MLMGQAMVSKWVKVNVRKLMSKRQLSNQKVM